MSFTLWNPLTWFDDTKEEEGNQRLRDALAAGADDARVFANAGQTDYNRTGQWMDQTQRDLQDRASGAKSVSAEQLRQALQQQLAQQKSMAAGAGPNAAMAARNAANNMGRASYGLAGQQAVAGLAEQQMALQQLGQMLGQRRGQELQAALGSRQNQLSGLQGALNPIGDKTAGERFAGAIGTGIGAASKLF